MLVAYLWIDATYVKVRQNGRIVSVAVIVAVGVNGDGRREVLESFPVQGHSVTLATVNLAQPWPAIANDLLDLLTPVRARAPGA